MPILLLSILSYSLAFIFSLISHLFSPLRKIAFSLLLLGLFFYTLRILTLTFKLRGFPFADTYGFYSLLGNGMLLLLILLSLRQAQLQGFFAFFSLLGILSTVLAMPAEPSPYRNPLYSLHITSALLSYAFSLLGGLFSSTKFVVESKIKHKSLEGFFLPLSLLRGGERLSINLSFLFFTLTLIFGSLWSRSVFGTHWIKDPKLVYVLFLWLYYAVLVHLNILKKIKPKTLSYGILLGAILSLLSLFFVRHAL
ncbi:MAG: cytochrome c biogenesis protein CcsA [Aquificaceae bacterium]